ncbi:MAG TPA: hypothetical protein VLX08_07585 [Steroidobacteraceae bacterium]|nr:hypothetical protein [Steroidobacteraceae bacterium]
MRAVPHLWQRYPATARVVAVTLLAVPAIVVGTVLFRGDYDPWIIVAVVVVFAFTARWILERAGRKG